MSNDMIIIIETLLEYIDTIPDDVVAKFPTMPGISREYIESVLINYNTKSCNCSKLIEVRAKCNDLCYINVQGYPDYNGYVPGLNIGSGDYIDFKYCYECGKIQADWPLDISDFMNHENV